ncbi:hypothetical protein [uncultured Eudoraea sp.]|uniref:hypothetical protein n=1 Tax=uncultured Eudoraea sp. TaxID=1035614 RepID=UPI0026280110|nr:hypothetical protein [uncultured Eudoraea sp.]
MKRRNFVLLTGIGISAIAISTWYYKYRDPENDQLLSEPELLSYIWDDNTISEIGMLYLEKFSDENSEPKLIELLSNNVSTDIIENTEMLNQQITNDYKTGNTIMIAGWILSRTEARQCALFSLTQNN